MNSSGEHSPQTDELETHPWLVAEAQGDKALLNLLVLREKYFEELVEASGQMHADPLVRRQLLDSLEAVEDRKVRLCIKSLEQP